MVTVASQPVQPNTNISMIYVSFKHPFDNWLDRSIRHRQWLTSTKRWTPAFYKLTCHVRMGAWHNERVRHLVLLISKHDFIGIHLQYREPGTEVRIGDAPPSRYTTDVERPEAVREWEPHHRIARARVGKAEPQRL